MTEFIKKYIMTILAISIYAFVLVTSTAHTIFFLSSFEPPEFGWLAFSIALALDIGLFYMVFASVVMQIRRISATSAKIAYYFLIAIVFIANWISMFYFFPLNKYNWHIGNWNISVLFPLIAASYLPFLTVMLAYVGAKFLPQHNTSIHKRKTKKINIYEIERFIEEQLKIEPNITIVELQKLLRSKYNIRIGKQVINEVLNGKKRP